MIRKVLIVEDEKDIRFLLKNYFKQRNYEVLEADSLQLANDHLEQLDEHTLVTLDLNLPDGSGFTFLEKLRTLKKKCKVVICSAYSDKSKKALEMGADHFVEKPILMSKLESILA